MLEALKSLEIDNTCHFIGTEHPIHCRFEELNGDVSSNFSPDVSFYRISRPSPDSLSGKHPGIAQIFSL